MLNTILNSIHTRSFSKINRAVKSLFITSLVGIVPLAAAEGDGQSSPIKHIAITQITSHESLDKVRQGVMDALKEAGYVDARNARISFANAQGDIGTAAQIAKKFVSLNPDVVVAIATPSAQSMISAARGSTLPIVFATVTDPIGARLVSNLEKPGSNVTGTRNVPALEDQVKLMKQVIPGLKTVGIVVNYSEDNAVQLLGDVKRVGEAYGVDVIASAVDNSAAVSTATRMLMGRVDALLLLQDNTVASALPSLLKVANKYGAPAFSTYVDAVSKGALMGLSFDEYEIGRQTGAIVVRILKGENPGDIAVEDPSKIELAMNLDVAKRLKIAIGPDLIGRADALYSAPNPK